MKKDRYSDEEFVSMSELPIWAQEDATKNFQWRILDDAKAKELHIELIEIKEGRALLSIEAAYIQHGMSFDEYITFIQEKGIVVNGAFRKGV